jgi:TetR/AcrR family fatty acid metabolism transcriptional regulator
VAKEAGVAYGLVYHYFRNKEELLASVFDATWTGFVHRLHDVVTAQGSLEETVQRVVRLAFDAYRVDPRAVRVLILEIARSPAGGRVNRGSAFIEVIRASQALFERARDAGELDPDADPLLCAASLFGAVEMGLTSLVLGLAAPPDAAAIDRAAEQVSRHFLRGILPRSEAELSWKNGKSATKSKALRRS